MLSIGLMSGTSMDGIDVALIETDGTPALLKEYGSSSLTYDPRFSLLLKATEYAVRQCQGQLAEVQAYFSVWLNQYWQQHHIDGHAILAYLGLQEPVTYDHIARHSAHLHVELIRTVLRELKRQPEDISVIGYHGQTLYHQPEDRCCVLLGDPQYMADQLGIRVVYDFRRQDIEAGGQGAPFAPLYHHALAVRDGHIPLVVVNCGGIANITVITDEKKENLLAFDTGPGNALVDSLVRKRTCGQQCMDKNGEYGKKGTVNEKVLQALHDHAVIKHGQNYFTLPPPKSLDYGDMLLIPELETLSLEEACATLEVFTARAIIEGLQWVNMPVPSCWVLAGGGWYNPVIYRALVEGLQSTVQGMRVYTADEIGWNAKALEAQIFAYLAVRSIQHQPLSLPTTTRVPAPLSGGELFSPT